MRNDIVSEIFGKDTELRFPHFAVLRASAGSGKTHALTARFVQYLLSEKIPHNGLRNIMAVTFSNNAAKEMRERIIGWLKAIALSDGERLKELSGIVSLSEKRLTEKADMLVNVILDNYSDFQVRTIDSFMTSVFRASAMDFGYSPEFEILFGKGEVMKYSFDLFLKNVNEGTREAALLDEVTGMVAAGRGGDSAFLWDPSAGLLEEVKKLYGKMRSLAGEPEVRNLSPAMAVLKNRIRGTVRGIEDVIERSGLERNRRSAYTSADFPGLAEEGRQVDMIGKGMKMVPVKKTKGLEGAYDEVTGLWDELKGMLADYASCYARSYYYPSFRVFKEFGHIIESVKKSQGKVFIDDINRYLSGYLRHDIVPDIYFRLGETVYHYLIDEFQDTSPVQWNNLLPLLENSLSQDGSLFVVGDTKQAIYGFRDADYRIMKGLERVNPFPSARHGTKELSTNYRSRRRVLALNEAIFHGTLHGKQEYREAGTRSGLADYVQDVLGGRKSEGYAEVVVLRKDPADPPERDRVQQTVEELVQRGFSYRDIAILTQKNDIAVMATTWLNEKQVPFISYSSLDIRRRKVTGEIIALLTFLDSPVDDHAFAIFLFGDVFAGACDGCPSAGDLRDFVFRERETRPLYTAFRDRYPLVWEQLFSRLFRAAGYLPVYDLVTAIFSAFRVFGRFPREEAALVKMLEVIKEFEGAGYNSLGDFLDFAEDDVSEESAWNMDVPKDLDAVKVMTIHKAKGLGFPVVILLLYPASGRPFDHIVAEEKGGYSMLKVTRKICASNEAFETYYEEERMKDRVNSLNALYVGLTRAEEELYVIGVRGEKNDTFPFDILPEEGFGPSEKPDREKRERREAQRKCRTGHGPAGTGFPREGPAVLRGREQERGEFMHEILSRIEYAEKDIDSQLARIVNEVSRRTVREYDAGEIIPLLKGLVQREGIGDYFSPLEGRRVMTEQDFSDREGRLYRMDRVVVDPDAAVVMDFKTGTDRKALSGHEEQVRTYMNILRGVWPGVEVKGIIAYIDTDEVRRVP